MNQNPFDWKSRLTFPPGDWNSMFTFLPLKEGFDWKSDDQTSTPKFFYSLDFQGTEETIF